MRPSILKAKKDVCLIHKFITSQNDALNERGHALIWNADFRKEVLILKMSFDGLSFTPHPPLASHVLLLSQLYHSPSLRWEARQSSLCLRLSFTLTFPLLQAREANMFYSFISKPLVSLTCVHMNSACVLLWMHAYSCLCACLWYEALRVRFFLLKDYAHRIASI